MNATKHAHPRPKQSGLVESGMHSPVRVSRSDVAAPNVTAEMLQRHQAEHPTSRRVVEEMKGALKEIHDELRKSAQKLLGQNEADLVAVLGEAPTEDELVSILDEKISDLERKKREEKKKKEVKEKKKATKKEKKEKKPEFTDDILKIRAYQVIAGFDRRRLKKQIDAIIRAENDGYVSLYNILEKVLRLELDGVSMVDRVYEAIVVDSAKLDKLDDRVRALIDFFNKKDTEVYDIESGSRDRIWIDHHGKRMVLPEGKKVSLKDMADEWDVWDFSKVSNLKSKLMGYPSTKIYSSDQFFEELQKELKVPFTIKAETTEVQVKVPEVIDEDVLDREVASLREKLGRFFDGPPAPRENGMPLLRQELERAWMHDELDPLEMFKPKYGSAAPSKSVQRYRSKGMLGRLLYGFFYKWYKELPELAADLDPYCHGIYRMHELGDHYHGFGSDYFIDAMTPQQRNRAWRLMAMGYALGKVANERMPDVQLYLAHKRVKDEVSMKDIQDLVDLFEKMPTAEETKMDQLIEDLLARIDAQFEIEAVLLKQK